MKRVEMLPRLPHDKSNNISRKATVEEVKQMAREDFNRIIKLYSNK